MMTLPEAAKTLGVAASTLRQQIAKRKLTATKLGRDWYLTSEEVERYRREHLRGAA
jgi:excisionase family DNA binding protein